MIRIGHKGAAALAPENTLLGIERALAVGVDMVEVDVLARADGMLVLAHGPELLGPDLTTLDEALALLAASGAGVLLDVKAPGYEEPLTHAVRAHGLVERALVSSCHAVTLRRVADLEPGLALGLTYPYDRHGISTRRLLRPATAGALLAMRAALPRRIGRLLERARATAAVLHYSVVSRATVARAHAREARVIAWTVDDPLLVARLERAGVDGVITNDPRIFGGTL